MTINFQTVRTEYPDSCLFASFAAKCLCVFVLCAGLNAQQTSPSDVAKVNQQQARAILDRMIQALGGDGGGKIPAFFPGEYTAQFADKVPPNWREQVKDITGNSIGYSVKTAEWSLL